LFPEIVIDVPAGPDVGDIPVMTGDGTTVNKTPLLALPLTVTTVFPVVAPVGTTATIVPAFQNEIVVAVVPLNLTVLVPWLEPNLLLAIVMEAPTAPTFGDRLVMVGPTP